MSGRKQSEVISVLEQGERARRKTVNIHSTYINNAKHSIKMVQNSVDAKKNEILQSQSQLHEEVGKYYPKEVKEIEQEQDSIEKGAASISIPVREAEQLEREFNNLQNALSAADREANLIRNAIRNKYAGYCDAEYSRARSLVSEYRDIANSMARINRQMDDLKARAGQSNNQCESYLRRYETLKKKIDNLNMLVENREKSDALRADIEKNVQEINIADAEKFMETEYISLKESVSDFIRKNDKAVIAAGATMMAEVNAFLSSLNDRVTTWKKQKKDAEDYLAQIDSVGEQTFVDPIEETNQEENPTRYALFAFIDKYTQKDFTKKYDMLLGKVKDLLDEEKFLESMDYLKKMDTLIHDAYDYALALQENMLKKSDLAATLVNVMYELHYDVNAEIIGDNPNNGFCITCNVGDEEIKFEKVDINDDGKVIINIDHTEGTISKCQNAWKPIVDKCRSMGIPMTDVTKNGSSVLPLGGKQVTQDGERLRG